MKTYQKDILSIIFVVAVLVCFHFLGFFQKNSVLSKLVKPIQKKVYFSIEDAVAILDKREQEGYEPKTGMLMLSDFESPLDTEKWRHYHTSLELSSEQVGEGNFSGKVVFTAGQADATKIFLQYFPKRWENFESLNFEIYNPQSEQFRIILQIKDRSEKRYKQNLYLKSKKWNKFSISMDDLGGSINTKKIVDLNFFRWKPGTDVTVFFDNIRLLSPGYQEPTKIAEGEKTYSEFEKDNLQKYKVKKHIEYKKDNSVSFSLKNPCPTSTNFFPFTVTIQFPRNKVNSNMDLSLKSNDGQNLPFQTTLLNKWSNGSIKDILLDFQPNIPPHIEKVFTIFYGKNIDKDAILPTLEIKNQKNIIQFNTGSLKFHINKNHFTLFEKVWLDINGDNIYSQDELISRAGDIILSCKGVSYRSSLDYSNYKLEIVEAGKMRTTLKAEGYLKSVNGYSLCKFETIINVFAGKCYIEINQNFIFREDFLIDSALILIPYLQKISQVYSPNTGVQMNLPVMLFQSDKEKCEVRYGGRKLSFDKNLSNWIDVGNSSSGLTICLSPNWQLPQKSYFVDEDKIAVYLWPPMTNPLKMKKVVETQINNKKENARWQGLNSTHHLLFYFHKEDMAEINTTEVANSFLNPVVITNQQH